MILRLDRLGFAVENTDQTRRVFRDLFGLESWAEQPDPLTGVRKAATIPFPNTCSFYLMESSDPASTVCRYLQEKGPGLERVVFLVDDIQEAHERLNRAGAPVLGDAIQHTAAADRLIVLTQPILGMTVELVQSNGPLSLCMSQPNTSGVLGLQHIGVAVRNLQETGEVFERLFDLKLHGLRTDQHEGEQKDAIIEPGNDRLWLHVTESWGENARVCMFLEEKGPGLEHVCIEVTDIRDAVRRVTSRGVRVYEDKIFTNRDDGFEAFVYPDHTTGVTVELIEPYPTSRGYRVRK